MAGDGDATTSAVPRTYRLHGVDVAFPYDAYACQLALMDRTIAALSSATHALLESPTGTGKTLSMLCATLAWREHVMHMGGGGAGAEQSNHRTEGAPPASEKHVIVYASRTHAQLTQVVRELKKTPYRPKTAALGSRTQCCVHASVAKLESNFQRDVACRKLVSARSCAHHRVVEPYVAANPHVGGRDGPVDIEELVRLGNSQGGGSRANKAPGGSGLDADRDAAVERTANAVMNKLAAASQHGPCPFYLGRELARHAELVFVPYNYLIDDSSRKALVDLIPWNGAVVIFDEAHNVGQAAAEAASFELPASLLSAAIREAEKVIELCLQRLELGGAGDGVDVDWSRRADEFRVLKHLLVTLERTIADALKAAPNAGPQGGGGGASASAQQRARTECGEWVFQQLLPTAIPDCKGTGENGDTLPFFVAQLQLGASVLAEHALASGAGTGVGSSASGGGKLQQLAEVLNKAAGAYRRGDLAHYRAHLRLEEQRIVAGPGGVNAAPTLSLWCFLAGPAMKALVDLGVRSCLFTSGTLSPMPAMARELSCPGGLSFPHMLENAHVISRDRLWIGVVQCGPSGGRMLGDFQRRSDARYISDVGNALCNVARLCPGGVLVFFSSYGALDSLRRAWEVPAAGGGLSVWQRLERHKEVFVEPRGAGSAEAFRSCLTAYRESCTRAVEADPVTGETGRGGLFLSVCRGKASEGMDFKDHEARCVVMVGIPYASAFDPRVKLHRSFLDDLSRKEARNAGPGAPVRLLTGGEWYQTTAARAANQAVGRVVRHVNDWGAIVLLDERFANHPMRPSLSRWVQDSLATYPTFGRAVAGLAQFFLKRRQESPIDAAAARAVNTAREHAIVGDASLSASSIQQQHLHEPTASMPLTQVHSMPTLREANTTSAKRPRLAASLQKTREEEGAKRHVDAAGGGAAAAGRQAAPAGAPAAAAVVLMGDKNANLQGVETATARREATKNPALQLVAKMRKMLPPGVFSEIQELLRGLKAHTIHFKSLMKELARLLVDEPIQQQQPRQKSSVGSAGVGGEDNSVHTSCQSPYRDILGDLSLFVQSGSSQETRLRAHAFQLFLAGLDKGLCGKDAVKNALKEVRKKVEGHHQQPAPGGAGGGGGGGGVSSS